MKRYLLSTLALAGGLLAAGCTSAVYTQRAAPARATEPPSARAAVLVRIATPWYAPRFVVRGKFRDALPEYEALAPLVAKYFTITDDGKYGGIYLWKSREDAERHFDDAWRAGVRARRGVEPDVLVMDAPYVVDGPAAPVGKPIGARSIEYPASASFVRLELPEGADPTVQAKTIAGAPWGNDALVRGFVVTGPRFVGVIALWATREAAEGAVTAAARQSMGESVGAIGTSYVLFEAPLLVDGTLRGS